MTTHTQLIKVMSGLAALLQNQLTNSLEDLTLLLASFFLWHEQNVTERFMDSSDLLML